MSLMMIAMLSVANGYRIHRSGAAAMAEQFNDKLLAEQVKANPDLQEQLNSMISDSDPRRWLLSENRNGDSKAMKSLLLMLNPTAAFNFVGLAKVAAKGKRMATERIPVVMQSGEAFVQLAQDCIDEGCPLMTVEELLLELKAEKNPSAEIDKTIGELEKKLDESKSSRKDVEKLLEGIAKQVEASSEAKADTALDGIEDLVQGCIDEGCPIYTVEELLARLQKVASPSAELKTTIEALDKRAKEIIVDQQELEKIVAFVSKR
jgi:hypothetical protein